jgi:hypothetical protein
MFRQFVLSTFSGFASFQSFHLRIEINSDAIEKTEQHIESLNQTLMRMEKLPLGAIIAWNELDADSHPRNWVECDGRIIQGYNNLNNQISCRV